MKPTRIIKNIRNQGFTLVEMMISVVISSLLLYFVYRFFLTAGIHMKTGVLKLESLDQARIAISYLRRDFSTACPFVSFSQDTSTKDPEHEYAAKNLIRKMVFYQDLNFITPPEIRPNMNLTGNGSFPIQYSKAVSSHLRFYHFQYKGSSSNYIPRVEQVEYMFDPVSKLLTRVVAGRKINFTGMKEVDFQFLVPQWASETVMLKIDMTVENVPKQLEGKLAPTLVRLVTTISSQFISSNLFDPNWNFEGYQKKL